VRDAARTALLRIGSPAAAKVGERLPSKIDFSDDDTAFTAMELVGLFGVKDAQKVLLKTAMFEESRTRRMFAARALEGEFLSDAQIDFLLDPSRRVTCAHLQPVEQALRAAGAPMTVGEPGFLWTEWSLDGPRLLREMPLPGVHWQVPAAHPRDPQPGYLRCPACGSRIEGGFGASFPRA